MAMSSDGAGCGRDWPAGSGCSLRPFQRKSPLERQLADSGRIWADIALKYDLVESDLSVLSSAWHTDADLGRPIEVVTDMSKSRKLGFLEYQATDDSFFDLFSRLRAANVIP